MYSGTERQNPDQPFYWPVSEGWGAGQASPVRDPAPVSEYLYMCALVYACLHVPTHICACFHVYVSAWVTERGVCRGM